MFKVFWRVQIKAKLLCGTVCRAFIKSVKSLPLWQGHDDHDQFRTNSKKNNNLCTIFLTLLEEENLFSRLTPMPLAAYQDTFYNLYDSMVSWEEMTWKEKKHHFQSFLMHQFSLDPACECMMPPPEAEKLPCNNAGWPGFYLDDEEVAYLAEQTIKKYKEEMVNQRLQPMFTR